MKLFTINNMENQKEKEYGKPLNIDYNAMKDIFYGFPVETR